MQEKSTFLKKNYVDNVFKKRTKIFKSYNRNVKKKERNAVGTPLNLQPKVYLQIFYCKCEKICKSLVWPQRSYDKSDKLPDKYKAVTVGAPD